VIPAPRAEAVPDDVLLPIDPPLFGSLSSSSRNRAVFSHPEPEPEYDNDFNAPTFGYVGEKRISAVPIAIVIILALVVAAFFFLTRTDSGQRMLQSGKEHVAAIRSSASGSSASSNHSQPASPPPQAATSPPPVSAPASSTRSQTATTNSPSSASPPAAQSNNQPSDAEAADASDATAAEERHPNLRYVPANVMEGNLLAAPRPVYPPAAREAHLEGIVALQATISRSGSVMTLHVIRGPRELRSAAIDAVRRWRYRPYEVDGRPTQVATNIYVHFTLGPPPTIVR
jgi:TonB family protein